MDLQLYNNIVVPTPAVSITSNIVTVGNSVTLTCTVELSSSVDVPVTVNTVWTGPDNFNRNVMAQRIGSTATYTSTVMVSSFGRDQSGDYTCTATVSLTSPFITGSMSSSPLTRVTVGKECVSGIKILIYSWLYNIIIVSLCCVALSQSVHAHTIHCQVSISL